MRRKRENKLQWLYLEMENIQHKLKELENRAQYRSPVLSHMPQNRKKHDFSDTLAEKEALENLLKINLKKIQAEKIRLEQYIGSIEDAELRLIIRMREIEGMKWAEIGDSMGMDRTTVSKKYHKYLSFADKTVAGKDSHKSH